MHLGGLYTRNPDPSGVEWEEEPRWPTPLGFLLRAGLTLWESVWLGGSAQLLQ